MGELRGVLPVFAFQPQLTEEWGAAREGTVCAAEAGAIPQLHAVTGDWYSEACADRLGAGSCEGENAMVITKLDQILEAVKSKAKKRLVAAWAVDGHTIEAVNEAREKGIIDATLVGDEAQILKALADLNLDPANFEIIHEATDLSLIHISEPTRPY